jgi:PII-like signaling protein
MRVSRQVFGPKSRIRRAKFLRLSSDLPVVIEIVDTAEKIDAFLPEVEETVHAGMVTLERVETHFYRSERK